MKKLYTLIALTALCLCAMAQSRAINPFQQRLQQSAHYSYLNSRIQDTPRPSLGVPAKSAHRRAATIDLPIDHIDGVTLYTNEAYSHEGAWDYMFSISNSADEFGFPSMAFDIFMPSADSLTAGTYTIAKEQVDHIMLIRDYNDYIYYYYGYERYYFDSAEVTLTHNGGQSWTIDLTATDADGITYKAHVTGEINVEVDDYDPNEEPEEPQEPQTTYKWEPTEVTTIDVTFNSLDRSDAYVRDYNIVDFILDTDQTDAKGHRYTAHLYYWSATADIPAGTYPINDSEELGTWLASVGCSITSNSKDYPCYLNTYDDTYTYDSWYMVDGTISISYNTQGQICLDGNAKTYNGSTILLHYNPGTEGLNHISSESTITRKYLKDRQLYIQHGCRTFNAQGIAL